MEQEIIDKFQGSSNKLNPHVKEIWLQSLRSDKFKQGHGTLSWVKEGEPLHCCLGVLCETLKEPLNIVSKPMESSTTLMYGFDGELRSGYIPSKLGEFIGINGDQQIILSTMNDKEKKSFSEIADYIEKNL